MCGLLGNCSYPKVRFWVTAFSQKPAHLSQQVDRNRTEQSAEQCQHPGEGTHIHDVEQVRPQGKKNNTQNNGKRHNKNCIKLYPTIHCNNPDSDTG